VVLLRNGIGTFILESDFEVLTLVITEVGSSKPAETSKLESQRRSDATEFLLPPGAMNPLYSKSTKFKCSSHPKLSHRSTQDNH
jgi:hypothetical protein